MRKSRIEIGDDFDPGLIDDDAKEAPSGCACSGAPGSAHGAWLLLGLLGLRRRG